jgi:histidine triad (HIT) family protein
MSDCIFCRIVAGEVPSTQVYEDDRTIVIKDLYPKAPVHLLVLPRAHIESLNDLTPVHDGLIAHMLRLLPTLARQQGLDDGFRTIINTGPGGGQEVPHLHIHLLGGGRLPGF